MAATLSTDKLMSMAKRASKAGEWIQAVQAYDAVLQKFPKNKRAQAGMQALRTLAVPELLQKAQVTQQAGQWAVAETFLQAATRLAPELPDIPLALASCQLEMGNAPGAVAAAEIALGTDPNNLTALNTKGRALRQMKQINAAQQCLEHALIQAPNDAQTLSNLGVSARANGDRAAAVEYFQRAIAQTPNTPTLHHNLAHAKTFDAADADLDAIKRALAATGAQTTAAAPLHFALFKAYDDTDQADLAFEHLTIGNQQSKSASAFDFQNDAMQLALSKTLMAEPIQFTPAEPAAITPIFVTGLPRTGTSLIERMLSRLPDTQSCGELTVVQTAIGRLMREVTNRTDKTLSQADLQTLRTDILDGLAPYSDGSAMLIDKMPLNFRWIGLVAAAIPEAKFIHLRRDPMAVAWSLYRHLLSGVGNGFIYDPADIARYMVLHRDIMRHWLQLYPDRICDLNYADLVNDAKGTTEAMTSKLDLTWSPDLLSPEKATGPTLTASAQQVRQPIYQGSNEAWKRYEQQLAPLQKALETAGLL